MAYFDASMFRNALNKALKESGSFQQIAELAISPSRSDGDMLVFTVTCKTDPAGDTFKLWASCISEAHRIWGDELPTNVAANLASMKAAADRWRNGQREG